MTISNDKDLIEEIIKKKKKTLWKVKNINQKRIYLYLFSSKIWNQDSRNLAC